MTATLKGPYFCCLAVITLILSATGAISRSFPETFDRLSDIEASKLSEVRFILSKKGHIDCAEFLTEACRALGPERCYGFEDDRDRAEFGNHLLELFKARRNKPIVSLLESCGLPAQLGPPSGNPVQQVERFGPPVMMAPAQPSSPTQSLEQAQPAAPSMNNDMVLSEIGALKNEVVKIEETINVLASKLCGPGWPNDCTRENFSDSGV